MRYRSTVSLISVIIAALMLVSGTTGIEAAFATSDAVPEFTSFDQLNGKRIGLLTGAPFEELIHSKVSDPGKIEYYSSMADEEMALKDHKIDAYFTNNAVAELAANKDSTLAVFPEPLGETVYGYAFAKGDPDRDRWEQALSGISDREKKALWDEWMSADESGKSLPEQDWPGSNGTVTVAACDTMPPMSYRGANAQIEGFDIELLLMMAEELDVHLVFTGMEFSSTMATVESGKAKIAAGCILVNDERKQAVDFVEYYPASYVFMVRAASDGSGGEGFFAKLKDSFRRNFITDNRYRMVLSGLWLTIVISVSAGILGLLIAFALVFVRHSGRKLPNRAIDVYCALVAGIPAVVILMVLYYIIFGAVDLPAVLVASAGFALIFGARACGTIWSAVCAVDPVQTEAALALGYSGQRAFREIILPQAKGVYLPVLKGQFINLVKETSVAGYITVLELTRAGDLIRSRTMEAFFPLIAVAVIYFLLTWIITKLIGLIDVRDARKRSERKIKGIDA